MHNDYIAGFFDGEGHVDTITKTLTIVNTNHDILLIIQNELLNNNIKSVIYTRKIYNSHHKQAYSLRIHGFYNITNFSSCIKIIDIDKNNKLKLLLSSYKNPQYSDEEKQQMIKLKNDGFSMRKIAKELNRSNTGTVSFLNKTCHK